MKMRKREVVKTRNHRRKKALLASAKLRQNLPSHPGKDQKRRRDVSLLFTFPSPGLGLIIYSVGGPRVEVEYEHEMESVPLTKEALANW